MIFHKVPVDIAMPFGFPHPQKVTLYQLPVNTSIPQLFSSGSSTRLSRVDRYALPQDFPLERLPHFCFFGAVIGAKIIPDIVRMGQVYAMVYYTYLRG